tara:strand:+ start:5922 stop:6593 length:672 start_codon:yes stop_codon:yes gene_type:complete
MLTALLIEDDYDLANTVIDFLSLENIECDHASNGVSGLTLLQQNRYGIVLLDLNLPRLDGLQVCEALRKTGADIPVLMLTARDQLKDKVAGFNAGTDDYLVKPFELEELVVRVRALSRRRSGQVQLLQCSDLIMNLAEKTVTRNNQLLKLSPTAWQLLETLLRASPNPVSRNDLEHAIWGDEVPDSNSLKVHLFNLRKTIDSGSTVALIHTIVGFGFALRETP